jgi:hypothetical protein
MTFLKKIKKLEAKVESQNARMSSLLEQVEKLLKSNIQLTALSEEILYTLESQKKEGQQEDNFQKETIPENLDILVQNKTPLEVN